ncbi:uncharacterized protein HMPREF1541_08794 [Cyphellophora europaea CBS 101466]|uniref:cyclin-dependent kinase n=1 Tax=Cyphellophora europaea (strain CBS 101466) TaxID=1220924 RepID=W2RJ70_CYPE1|nr:uncharacterized protein HMPREF1541_08794 [Cyphellophora europaea CBS 101466]ETN36516.1 hypothetical protein HMPREF1541_08794 [Cyphellophora europaea CBS 101466]
MALPSLSLHTTTASADGVGLKTHTGPQSHNSYHHNSNQGHSGPPNGPSNRGNRGGYRGGKYNQQGPPQDRRFSGPGAQYQPSNRGRGNHQDNSQFTPGGPRRGGGQNSNYQPSHSGSRQPSPTHSQYHSRGSREQTAEDDSQHRPSKDLPGEERREPNGQPLDNQGNTNQAKDSKFSFAFKSKQTSAAPAKAPPDLNTKGKPPFEKQEGRPPPTQPKGQGTRFDQTPSQRYDKNNRHQDRRPPFPDQRNAPVDRRYPYGRPHSNDRRPERSRSPPPKRLKPEPPKPRPRLPPEFAESESIYYRKPGNESVVGAGTYGKVFKAIHIYTRDKVALKKIRMEGERDGYPITAVREIRLLQHLRHKHVVALHEVMVEKNECFMVFEYMSHDLTGLINHPTFKLTAAHQKNLAFQMFDGLEFLHRRGVLHRDIKAANILVSNTGQLKYADFGLARFYTKSRQLDYTNRVITIWYRPPELLLGETQYGPAVDIWSAACVFMEMFTRKAVFPGEGGELSQLEKVYNVLGTPTRAEWAGIVDLPWFELMQPATRKSRQFEAMFNQMFSPKALELIQWCFKYDPTQRPSAEEVLQHGYFTTEEPEAHQPVELAQVDGDWHEFESKQHRKDKERRRKEEWEAERAKRKKAEKDAREGKISSAPATGALEGQGNASTTKVPAAPMPEAEQDDEGGSDGEGSARMSMS